MQTVIEIFRKRCDPNQKFFFQKSGQMQIVIGHLQEKRRSDLKTSLPEEWTDADRHRNLQEKGRS